MSWLSTLMPARLAHRIALTLGLLSLALAAAIWLYGQYSLRPAIAQSEQQAARAQAEHTRDLFVEAAAALERQADSLANWDDAYLYATGADPQRLNAFLDSRTHNALGLDFLAVFDPRGDLMTTAEWGGKGVFRDELMLTRELDPATSFGRIFTQAVRQGKKVSGGVVRLARGPYYVSIAQIRPASRQGGPAGYLVTGVAADKLLLQTKGAYSATLARVVPITARDLPDQVLHWVGKREPASDELLIFRDDATTQTWNAIPSLDGKPALLLGSSQPRDMSRVASERLAQIALIAVGGTLLLGLVAWGVVHALISRRLGALLQSVHGLTRPGQTALLETRGNDEVAFLTRAVNQLAHGKNTSIEALRQVEHQLDLVFAQSPSAMLLVRDGQLSDANAAATALLKAQHSATLVGKHLSDIVESSDATARRLLLLTQSRQLDGEIPPLLCRVHALDGSLISCDIKALRLPLPGKPTLYLFISPLAGEQAAAGGAEHGGRLISISDRLAPRHA